MKNITMIFGGTGCGKTTFAAALAAQLARSGVHTLLISPDTHVPAFGLWTAKGEPVSVGKILETMPEKVNLATDVFIPRGLKENLGLLGFLPNEAADKYTPASGERASDFLRLAAELADQVVVDGTAYCDSVTTAAVKEAAVRIRLLEPGPRGFLSVTSALPEKAGGKTLWIACPCFPGDPVEETATRLHIEFAAELPHLPEAHVKLNEGRLFEPYRDKRYRASVGLAVRAVLEGTA
jgi:energy-coupling factor transporter ATP-binding protein EcfA2